MSWEKSITYGEKTLLESFCSDPEKGVRILKIPDDMDVFQKAPRILFPTDTTFEVRESKDATTFLILFVPDCRAKFTKCSLRQRDYWMKASEQPVVIHILDKVIIYVENHNSVVVGLCNFCNFC